MTAKITVLLSDQCFAHPIVMGLIFLVGALRPVMHCVESWLDYYAKKAWSPSQYVALYSSGSVTFWILDIVISIIFSISLATIHAAMQAWVIGDRDQRIQIPYQAAGPLPSEPQQLQPK